MTGSTIDGPWQPAIVDGLSPRSVDAPNKQAGRCWQGSKQQMCDLSLLRPTLLRHELLPAGMRRGLYSSALYNHGICSHSLYILGLYIHVLYSLGIYDYGLYSFGLYR